MTLACDAFEGIAAGWSRDRVPAFESLIRRLGYGPAETGLMQRPNNAERLTGSIASAAGRGSRRHLAEPAATRCSGARSLGCWWTCALLIVLSCGAAAVHAQSAPPQPAASSPAQSQAERIEALREQFRAGVEAAARTLENDPSLRGLSPQQRRDAIGFVTGNIFFAIVHEMGHVLISEFQLPVLGREEDAADAHAVLVLLRSGSTLSNRVLIDVAKGWFVSDQRRRDHGEKLAFYDEHGLDRQRAYQIVCLMVGSDPAKFAELAAETKLPEERQGTCQGDYNNAAWSWDKLLKPYLRGPDQPITRIDVVYDDVEDGLEPFDQGIRSMRILETVAELAAERYLWPHRLILEMLPCGQPDAHWNSPSRTLMVCYEMAQDFLQLYRYQIRSAGRATGQ
jgi:hypothetical protein